MSNKQTKNYSQHLSEIHKELGIVESYANTCGIPCEAECQNLVETELDVFSRQPLMDAEAFNAWQAMQSQALKSGVVLQIISAYRSADYQRQIFLNKIAKGQSINEILKVNAAPGYSEHHSGQAVDIGCPDYEHLSENFELSPAFRWLVQHAGSFGFNLSFPRNNSYGFIYEPWHWKFS